MKKYIINHDPSVVRSWSKKTVHEGINADDLLKYDYCIETTEVFSTFDESEAMEEFKKYNCDCYFTETMAGYQADIDYYELETVEGEMVDGEFEMSDVIDVKVAPFLRDVYRK